MYAGATGKSGATYDNDPVVAATTVMEENAESLFLLSAGTPHILKAGKVCVACIKPAQRVNKGCADRVGCCLFLLCI